MGFISPVKITENKFTIGFKDTGNVKESELA